MIPAFLFKEITYNAERNRLTPYLLKTLNLMQEVDLNIMQGEPVSSLHL